jgi:thiol-disulfide isomerase/thioredoxin
MNRSGKVLLYCMAIIVLVATMDLIFLIKIGGKAPDFTLPTADGGTVSLNDQRGKVVVVHLWSHTCPHCRIANASLQSIMPAYKNSNLTYIMIDIDADTSSWRSVIKEDKLDFAIQALDPYDGGAKTMIDYNGTATPCINIVDEKGNFAAVNVTTTQLNKYLKKRFAPVNN